MPTPEEVRAKLRAERRNNTAHPSPGVRFRNSELGKRLAAGDRLRSGPGSVEVTEDPWELRDILRNRSLADSLSALELQDDAARIVEVRPTPTALLPLTTIVPTSSTVIPIVVDESQVDDAGYAPDGQNVPGLTGASSGEWSLNYLETVPVGRAIPVPLEVLDDTGQAEAVIDRLITQNWRRAIENYVVSGDITNLIGITNTTGVFAVDASDTGTFPNFADAISDGVSSVQGGGFYGPHAVIAHPLVLRKIWTQKDSAGNYLHRNQALPTVNAWVPAPGVPYSVTDGVLTGTAIVCDPTEILVYLMGAFILAITQNYLDFLARGMAAVQGRQRAAIWIRNVDAFAIVENI